jgi:hypothetical protein
MDVGSFWVLTINTGSKTIGMATRASLNTAVDLLNDIGKQLIHFSKQENHNQRHRHQHDAGKDRNEYIFKGWFEIIKMNFFYHDK